jgi:hypothetical protein
MTATKPSTRTSSETSRRRPPEVLSEAEVIALLRRARAERRQGSVTAP